ncbi:MAG: mevalonate kinase [Candidatus Sericytochromatia bacterium]|nr:mevalonate kinase [Candidatus Sericytochromatia bacterium]
MSPRAALRTSAPAKIILGGEHAVVYGVPALVLPLSGLRTEVSLRESNIPKLRILLGDLPNPSEAQMAFVSGACRTITAALGHGLPDATLEVRSSVPIASGLGSSASLCVALSRAFSRLHGTSMAPADIQRLANEAEQAAHGRASGVDTAAIAWGRPLRFVTGQPPEPFALAGPLTLVIAHSGEVGSTQAAVMDVALRRDSEPDLYGGYFAGIREAVDRMVQALQAGDPAALGAAMTDNQRWLQAIGVSTPMLDRLVRVATQAGAHGAKLTGGGWGGCAMALAPEDRAEAIGRAMIDAGAAWAQVTTVGASQP